MKSTWVVALALIACSGKKDGDKDPKVAAGSDTPRAEDPQCADKVGPFADWMKALIGDGHVTVVATGVDLATIGVGPTPITRGAPVVTVKPAEVVVDGTIVADPSKTAGPEVVKMVGALIEPRPGPDVVYVIDGKVGWASVAPLLAGAAAAKHPRVTLVFAAGAPGAASPPARSSIDAELDALAASGAPDTAITAKVFADCAAVTQKLLPALDKVGTPQEFDVAVVTSMPVEIEACGCRVEMAAVQRLMWSWWGRDRGPALAAVKLDIAATAKDGTKITTAPETPWSEASQLVLAAAEQGKPISPQ